MASMNSLLVSWNFDSLNLQNTSNSFEVKDVSNNFSGKAIDFSSNTTLFLAKEEIKTNKKLNLETLDGSETIQILEEDDERISELDKPSSIKLMLENSMYQNISDEMLNMFSTIDAYAFKFMEPYHKYKSEYDKLEASRHQFFSKILEKPSLEKYIEFYKWIDSSLGYLLDQLIPETSFTSNSLKNTVESHILERNKYKHQLPLTTLRQKVFSNENIKTLIKTPGAVGISSSLDIRSPLGSDLVSVSDEIDAFKNKSIYNQNIIDENYFKNYEIFQSPGKFYNHRNAKTGKSIIKTLFSFPEKEENNPVIDYEFFSHSSFNHKLLTQRKILDSQEQQTSISLTRQGSLEAQTVNVSGKDYNTNNFVDNLFVQRTIPYKDENFISSSEDFLVKVPSEKVLHYRRQNIIIDNNGDTYELSQDIVEPPVERSRPSYHYINVEDSDKELLITSPFYSQIDTFTPRSLQSQKHILELSQAWEFIKPNPENTVFSLLDKQKEKIKFKKVIEFDEIFPRKDLANLAKIRTKAAAYEEEEGSMVLTLTNMVTPSAPLARNWQLSYAEDMNQVGSSYINGYYSISELIPDELLKTYTVPATKKVWTPNSYNNNSAFIRSFWKKDLNYRKTARGKDYALNTGSFNCFNFPNRTSEISFAATTNYTADPYNSCQKTFYLSEFNPYNSIYCMDSTSSYSVDFNNAIDPNLITINTTQEVYGDLGPYNNFYLARMLTAPRDRNTNVGIGDTIASNLKNIIYSQPKPSFIHNIFYPPITADDTVAIINCSYQTGTDCNLLPGYDTYDDFRKNIKHFSQFRSIIPEFNVSNYENIINNQTSEKEYLKIYGNETSDFNQIEKEDFYLDFNKFINKNTNAIGIQLTGVKKLLPYKGFYPQDRTVQIASIFSDEFFNKTGYVYDTSKTGSYVDHVPVHRYLSIMQPLFMPGILFNTIKSGISVSWPIRTYNFMTREGDSNTGEYDPRSEDENLVFFDTFFDNGGETEDSAEVKQMIYEQSSDSSDNCPRYVVKHLNAKLPFETILDPVKYYSELLPFTEYHWTDTSYNAPPAFFDLGDWAYPDPTQSYTATGLCLIYLDPSHYNPNIISDKRQNVLVKANLYKVIKEYWSNIKTKTYKSAINNFLAETDYFFLKNRGVTKILSKPKKSFKALKPGTTYAMDIIIEKNHNFSMFNKYINYENNKNLFIPPHSLFGPPVSAGSVTSNIYDYANQDLYLPYIPPYMRTGIAKITVKYEVPAASANYQSKRAIDMEELISDLIWEPPNFYEDQVYPASLEASESFMQQMTLQDCLEIVVLDSDRPNYNSDGKRESDSDENYKVFSIQPKFECPLINFKKCSFIGVESDSPLTNDGIDTERTWYDLPKDPEYT